MLSLKKLVQQPTIYNSPHQEPIPEHLVAMNSLTNMKEYTDDRALQEHIKKPN
jgi:hypothetical protein